MSAVRTFYIVYLLILTVGLVHPQGGDITGLAGMRVGEYPDIQHFFAFLVLSGFAIMARFDIAPLTLAGGLLSYAIAGEFVQAVIPGRTACFVDGLANVLGVVAGLGLMKIMDRRIREHDNEV